MQWLAVVLFCGALATVAADPDPKKYKTETKDSKTNTTLTDEERKFLREVEAKFGIKTDIPIEKDLKDEKIQNKDTEENENKLSDKSKVPFPAVIAIEIVNDTDANSKGKRTIDANLGYGYRTNNGYTYSYFGKPSQDKGKFMIYPYSQEDIPPARNIHQKYTGYTQNKNSHGYYNSAKQQYKYTTPNPNVEIQPSQAYELVPVQEEVSSYQDKKTQTEAKSKYQNHKNVEQHQSNYAVNENLEGAAEGISPPSTLYSTYNGGQLSGLSGQFPAVMPNYLVDPSQLLHNPQYQKAGLTTDHLRTHGTQLDQRVVPVLVLRIPSSYLRNPSAELYANLPQNYPLSHYLNGINIQELVNQYFKKIGYHFAPQVMTYQSPIAVPPANYDTQHYSVPKVRPSYTHANYAGVQYSAVQPVMAKYPISSAQLYSQQQYYLAQPQVMYHQVAQQPQYEYQYQYVQPTQAYYYPQYQSSEDQQNLAHQEQSVAETPEYGVPQANAEYESAEPLSTQYTQENKPHDVYGLPNSENQPSSQYELSKSDYDYYNTKKAPSAEYGPTKVPIPVYESQKSEKNAYESSKSIYGPPKTVSSAYGTPKPSSTGYIAPKSDASGEYGTPQSDETTYGELNSASEYGVPNRPQATYEDYASSEYENRNSQSAEYGSSKAISNGYGVPKTQVAEEVPKKVTGKETIAIYASQQGESAYKYQVDPESGATQSYIYQKYIGPDSQSKSLVISENYPSKDHTHVTVLPYSRKQNTATVQSVNYVTPQPFSSKYQHKYKVMVPQTVLKSDEKVTYVNSHSIPMHYVHVGPANDNYNPEEEYKVGPGYVPPVGNQKAPSFPRNYHSHPKRMTKNENKSDKNSETKKEKQPESTESKKRT